MNHFTMVVLGVVFWYSAASAQKPNNVTQPDETQQLVASETGVVGAPEAKLAPEYIPLTASDRWRMYLRSAFGPKAALVAAAAGAISQWRGTPKEWGGGAEGYGDRVGNSFAKHVIRETMEASAAAALHEDIRYVHSTDTGFWPRARHVLASEFMARDRAGREHFAYTRLSSAVGVSFISRIWQPRSANTSGDAAVTFGITVATDMAWNAFREFGPKRWSR